MSLNALIGAEFWRCGPRQRSVKSPLRVQRDRALGGVDELDLVRLALGLEPRAGLVGRDLLALPRAALGELAVHLGLDRLEVGVVDRGREVEVVVEAVLDRRPDRHLDAGVEPTHGLGEQVRGRVAEHGERVRILRVARRQDLELGAVRERQPQILRHPVGLDEHRLLGELRPDRAGGVEPARAVGQLELGRVGEDDLHRRPRIVGVAGTRCARASSAGRGVPPLGARLTRPSDTTRAHPAADDCRMPLPVYTGPFGPAQAERLLWRAGFGPRPGEKRSLAARGLDGAVAHLLTTGPDNLVGKPPKVNGHRLFPLDKFGHDHLWWLDRMVRTSRPLTERMTLVWHDWFATSNETVGSQRLMIRQNNMFRRSGLGSFPGLVTRVTENPAMLLYLNGLESEKGAPNENYARELMELFTLGHGSGLHGARRARAGPRPDRVHGDVQERVRLGQVPLRPQPARRRDEGRLRQARPVRLEAGRAC